MKKVVPSTGLAWATLIALLVSHFASSIISCDAKEYDATATPQTCSLRPYDLRVEHLLCGSADRGEGDDDDDNPVERTIVVIDPNPESPSPRFSWKAAITSDTTTRIAIPGEQSRRASSSTMKNIVLPGHPEAMASQVQVIRRNNDGRPTMVWDSGWLWLGRRNGLEVYRKEGQLPDLVEAEELYWRARFAISFSNSDGQQSSTSQTHSNDRIIDEAHESFDNGTMPATLQACEWSDYQKFTVGLSRDTWETSDWLCAPDEDVGDMASSSADESRVSDCDMYDTTGKVAAPLFRTEFEIPSSKIVDRATLFVTGLGYYEAHMNGIHVNSGRYLDPAPSSYDKRIYYNAFDITQTITTLSQHSKQILGLVAGNGWFNPLPLRFWGRRNLRDALPVGTPRVRCLLYIFFQNSTSPMIVRTDASDWQTTSSGLYRNDLYLGNVVDLDRHQALQNWSTTKWGTTNASSLIEWQDAKRCVDNTNVSRHLQPQPIPPIRARPPYILNPALQWTTEEGHVVLDMGSNTAAAVHIQMRIPYCYWTNENKVSNTTDNYVHEMEFRFGELLWPNGTVNCLTSVAGQIKHGNGGSPCAPNVAYQRLVLRGTKMAFSKGINFTTQFTFAGFRYIQILSPASLLSQTTSSNGRTDKTFTQYHLAVQATPLMSDLDWTATFNSSSPLLNEVYQMCFNTHASNMMGIQSDCPHRERFGYTGDALATLSTSLLLFGDSSFYEKRLIDTEDSQRSNGGITETAPFVGLASAGLGGGSGPIGWDTFFVELQVALYRYFGTKRTILDMQSSTQRWIDFIESRDDILIENGLGDWMAVDQTSTTITGRAFFFANLRAWSLLAKSREESVKSRKRALMERRRFNDMFVNRTTGKVTWYGSTPTQAAQAMALYYDLIPQSIIEEATATLIETIEARDNHLSTGMFGTTWLFEALAGIGRSDLAWKIATQTSYPSYGYMLLSNATTLWESWFFSNDTFSHNHPMFSGVVRWIIGSIGGVRINESQSIGGDRILFAPTRPFESNMTYAEATVVTARGVARCSWTCSTEGTMIVNISCPFNTRGTVLIEGNPPVLIGAGYFSFIVAAPQCEGRQDQIL